jgi:gliding motility-associated protein GldL
MNGMETLVQSKAFKKTMDKLYGFGASIVVLGALFKLEHWQGADYMLTAGLVTEAVIFFFYAFNSEAEPEVVNAEVVESQQARFDSITSFQSNQQPVALGGEGFFALSNFDKMLAEAEITPRMLQELGVGMRKLGETASMMNSMGNVSVASNQYMKTIKSADLSLAKLSKTYEDTISKVTSKTVFKFKSIANSLTVIEDEAMTYQRNMKSINRSLSDMSTVYMLQKREAAEYLNDMAETAADTKRYREEIRKLNENLSALNNVYGGMLNAMKVS